MTTLAAFPLRIETERLILYTAETKHVGAIVDYLNENKLFFQPWMPTYTPNFHSIAEQLRWIENDIQLYHHKVKLKLYFSLKTAPEIILGDIVFTNIIYGGFQSCFLGYKQSEKYNGNGYMKEAINKGVSYLFEEWKLHRVEANIVPRNDRSIKLITGLGFEREGLSKKYLKLNGVWEDHIHFAKLNQALEE